MKNVFDYLNYEWKGIRCCNQNKKYVECIFCCFYCFKSRNTNTQWQILNVYKGFMLSHLTTSVLVRNI